MFNLFFLGDAKLGSVVCAAAEVSMTELNRSTGSGKKGHALPTFVYNSDCVKNDR